MPNEQRPVGPPEAESAGGEVLDRDIALVAGTLAAAGIVPSAKELAILGRRHGGLRRQVDSLYAVDVGDDAPASHLRAAEMSGFSERSEGA